MTFGVMFRPLYLRPQPRRASPMKTAANLALAASLLVATAATGEPAMTTDHAHDFDFLIGKWNVHHWRLKDRLANSHEPPHSEGTPHPPITIVRHGTEHHNYTGPPSAPNRAVGARGYDPK